jgi:YggT family protein
MTPFANAGLMLVDTLFALVLFVVVLRVLLEFIRANFYNPICQAVFKITNPLIIPWQRFLPVWRGLNLAGVLHAVMIATIWAMAMVSFLGRDVGAAGIVLLGIARLVGFVLSMLFWIALARVLLSWFSPDMRNPAVPLLYAIADLVLRPFARVIPPIGGIDISPIFALLALRIAQVLLVDPLVAVALELG